jgi:hypothetical protein
MALGLGVRAMVHKHDARSYALKTLGAEIVLGDLLEIDTIRTAMQGTDAAHFAWPVQSRLIEATVNFIQGRQGIGCQDRHQPLATLGKSRLHEQRLPRQFHHRTGVQLVGIVGDSSAPNLFPRMAALSVCKRASSACRQGRDDTRRSPRMIKAAPSQRF